MSRLRRIRQTPAEVERYNLEQLAHDLNQFNYGGNAYLSGIQTTWGSPTTETIGSSYPALVDQAYKANGIVFACVLARLLLFSEARFQFQRIRSGRPTDLFGDQSLAILETPWPGGTTGDLLARMEQHVSLAGNAYVFRDTDRLRVLRPDWVTTVHASKYENANALDAELVGYVYQPGGIGSDLEPTLIVRSLVAHYAPIPDPSALSVGMSWLTPILSEVSADKAATTHKLKFFEHAATPNVIVKYPVEVTEEQVKQYVDLIRDEHQGAANAYKTLHLGGGADPMVVGKDFQQLEFKATQGAGETRIAAAAGVPPIVVGLSEGLAASTYSNYGQARRKFADGWARPAWRSAAGALANIVQAPADARLWYDARDVSFLQEDEKDAADILATHAQTIRTLTDAGYDPASVIPAVLAGDLSTLQHSGLYSVQLQAPGTGQPPAA